MLVGQMKRKSVSEHGQPPYLRAAQSFLKRLWLDALLLPNLCVISCCLERSEWVTPLASCGRMKACVHKVHFKTFQFVYVLETSKHPSELDPAVISHIFGEAN